MFIYGEKQLVGFGLMGGGIAMCMVQKGIPVVLIDAKQEFLDAGLAKITGLSKAQMRARFRDKDGPGSGELDHAQMLEVLHELREEERAKEKREADAVIPNSGSGGGGIGGFRAVARS